MTSKSETPQTMPSITPSEIETHRAPTALFTSVTKSKLSDGAVLAIGLGLLLIAILFDAYRPFNRQWSNLYFLIALYAAWLLRGFNEYVLYAATVLSMFLVSIHVRPEMPIFNRITGTFVGMAVVAVVRDRRRLIQGMEEANHDLEEKILTRTSELRATQRRLEDLSRQLIKTQETERAHLARELHDEVGQVLTAIKMNLRRLQRDADSSLIVQENFEMIDYAIDQVRNLALHLRPPQLDQLGLIAALHWLVKQQAKIVGFKERIQVIPTGLQVSPDLGLVCFRITQEAVTNAVRHASPNQIEIEVRHEDSELHLTIRDDGSGFDVATIVDTTSGNQGVGLSGMRERVSLAKGCFDIDSKPGHGTTIHAWFPYSTQAIID